MAPKIVVITGANRGVGLGLVQQFLNDSHVEILVATARDVERAKCLQAFKDERLHILPLKVCCETSMNYFILKLTQIVGKNGINLLINNSAVLVPYIGRQDPNRKVIFDNFDKNAFGVILLIQRLLPFLKTAANSVPKELGLSVNRSAVINITSEMLSTIGSNAEQSEIYKMMAFQMTKTGLHRFTRTFAEDVKSLGILTVGICPGSVENDNKQPDGEKDLTIQDVCSQLIECFQKLDKTHTGGLFRKDLSVISF